MPHVRRDQTTEEIRSALTGKKPPRRVAPPSTLSPAQVGDLGGFGKKASAAFARRIGLRPMAQGIHKTVRPGATDVAGTARKAPTTSRGRGRKTVVSGDPVKPRSGQAPSAQRGKNASNRAKVAGGVTPRGTSATGPRAPLEKRIKKIRATEAREKRIGTARKARDAGAGKARAIKQGQAARTARARRKSVL